MNNNTPESGASKERLGYLDAIRGIAALVVVLHHCFLATTSASFASHGSLSVALSSSGTDVLLYGLDRFFISGRVAVIIFFVLSGFVLTCALSARPTTYFSYVVSSLLFPAILWSVTRYRWRAVLGLMALSVACTECLLFWTGTVAQGFNDETFAATIFETGYFVVFFACGAYLAIARQRVSLQIASLPLWGKTLLFASMICFSLKADSNSHGVAGCVVDYLRGLSALGLIGLAMGIPKFRRALAHKIPIWLGRISYVDAAPNP